MAETKYKFTIKTKDQYQAGTDSNIFIRVYGDRGISNEVRTNGYISGNAYERGSKDTFTIPYDKDCGDIYRIDIRSDTMYSASAWFCESVWVKKDVDGSNETFFGVDQWIEEKDHIYYYTATSGYTIGLPETTKILKEFRGARHRIPANLEMKISCATAWKASINYYETSVNEISTGVSVEVEYMAVKTAIETELKTSIEKQTGRSLDKELTRQTEVTVPASPNPRILEEIWTEEDMQFKAILGTDYYTFSIPHDRIFTGFHEIFE